MIELKRTNSNDPGFNSLVVKLDEELKITDGEDHPFFAQYNKLDSINEVVIAYKNGISVGCGAFKFNSPGVAEIKRMYVEQNHRGQGIAGLVLTELEKWAKEMGYDACILETGNKQTSAITLYTKTGYSQIENYGQYKGVASSVCMEKKLN
jgi:putative acetyltransferase